MQRSEWRRSFTLIPPPGAEQKARDEETVKAANLGTDGPALLAFLMDATPHPGDVVLVRNKRGKQLALRRATGQVWAPLASWQPPYPMGGDWLNSIVYRNTESDRFISPALARVGKDA